MTGNDEDAPKCPVPTTQCFPTAETESGKSTKLTKAEAKSLLSDLSAYMPSMAACASGTAKWSGVGLLPRPRPAVSGCGAKHEWSKLDRSTRLERQATGTSGPSLLEVVAECHSAVESSLESHRGTIRLLSNPEVTKDWMTSHGVEDEMVKIRIPTEKTTWTWGGERQVMEDTEVPLSTMVTAWADEWLSFNPPSSAAPAAIEVNEADD